MRQSIHFSIPLLVYGCVLHLLQPAFSQTAGCVGVGCKPLPMPSLICPAGYGIPATPDYPVSNDGQAFHLACSPGSYICAISVDIEQNKYLYGITGTCCSLVGPDQALDRYLSISPMFTAEPSSYDLSFRDSNGLNFLQWSYTGYYMGTSKKMQACAQTARSSPRSTGTSGPVGSGSRLCLARATASSHRALLITTLRGEWARAGLALPARQESTSPAAMVAPVWTDHACRARSIPRVEVVSQGLASSARNASRVFTSLGATGALWGTVGALLALPASMGRVATVGSAQPVLPAAMVASGPHLSIPHALLARIAPRLLVSLSNALLDRMDALGERHRSCRAPPDPTVHMQQLPRLRLVDREHSRPTQTPQCAWGVWQARTSLAQERACLLTA